MIEIGLEELSDKFVDTLERTVPVLIRRNGRLEIAWVGQSIGPDWTEVRKDKMGLEYFEHIARRLPIRQHDGKEDASLNNAYFPW